MQYDADKAQANDCKLAILHHKFWEGKLVLNIYINGRFLTQSVTGVQRYANEIIKTIDQLLKKTDDVTLLVPKNIKQCDTRLNHIKIKNVGHLSGHLWEQIELPYYSRDGFLLNLCNTGPLVKKNQFITMHDAAVFAFPHAYSFIFRTWYKILLLGLGKRARGIITVSSFSKGELVKHCFIDERKIWILYEGREHILECKEDTNILSKHDLVNTKYVLAVSSMSLSKNFSSIVKATQLIGNAQIKFIIAGGTNPEVFNKTATPLPAEVKHIGYVSDAELKTLYKHATCFVYPSFYEGFGLPPIEAMTCGCPVVVSNRASLPEICDDAALYCDPDSPVDIANKLKLIIADSTLQATLKRKGLERVKHFSWDKCTRDIMTIIQEE